MFIILVSKFICISYAYQFFLTVWLWIIDVVKNKSERPTQPILLRMWIRPLLWVGQDSRLSKKTHDDMILTVRGIAPQDLYSDGGGLSEDMRDGIKME